MPCWLACDSSVLIFSAIGVFHDIASAIDDVPCNVNLAIRWFLGLVARVCPGVASVFDDVTDNVSSGSLMVPRFQSIAKLHNSGVLLKHEKIFMCATLGTIICAASGFPHSLLPQGYRLSCWCICA